MKKKKIKMKREKQQVAAEAGAVQRGELALQASGQKAGLSKGVSTLLRVPLQSPSPKSVHVLLVHSHSTSCSTGNTLHLPACPQTLFPQHSSFPNCSETPFHQEVGLIPLLVISLDFSMANLCNVSGIFECDRLGRCSVINKVWGKFIFVLSIMIVFQPMTSYWLIGFNSSLCPRKAISSIICNQVSKHC